MTTNAGVNKTNRSTGPRTREGKAKVATNAVKHGAYSEALTMLLESPESFATLRAGMVESFRPVGAMEENLVERMASPSAKGSADCTPSIALIACRRESDTIIVRPSEATS